MNGISATVGRCLAVVEEMRSVPLRLHEDGVARLSRVLSEALGLGPGITDQIAYGASLHDVGKVVIPDAVLNKPGPLDAGEWAMVRRHPLAGFRILEGSADPTMRIAAGVVLSHHEAWDGSGYPEGLAGEDIPREARIVGLCDVYQALREPRPYRAALRHDEVMGMILDGDGTGRLHPGKFDPAVLAAFRAAAGRLEDAFGASMA